MTPNNAKKFGLIIALAILSATPLSGEEQNPVSLLSTVIGQLQAGKPDPNLYSEQLQKVIAEQTKNSGQYPPLTAMGPVTDIKIVQAQPTPAGQLYLLQAVHAHGFSTWTLGLNSKSNRIEYANFSVSGAQPPPMLPLPGSPALTGSSDLVLTPVSPCKLYPALC